MCPRVFPRNRRRTAPSHRFALSLVLVILVVAILMAAGGGEAGASDHQIETRHAAGFTVEHGEHHRLVTVTRPWPGARHSFRYLLVDRGFPPPRGYPDAMILEVPVDSIVTMSTTYLAYMSMLGVLDRLVGHDNFRYVSTPEVLKRIRAGEIVEVGEGPAANVELLMALDPDVIMTSGLGGREDIHPKLLEAGFKVVLNADYMETTPLGRSEWIKFIALFFGREKEAENVFRSIERDYQRMRQMAQGVEDKPTVFTGAPYQGNWWIAGGRSYVATLLRHAGARYVFADDDSTGSRPVTFESIFASASEADYWLNTGTWNSLAEGLTTDERFRLFEAFRAGRVFNNNARTNGRGGNDYWESGYARPNEILADLIRIFHPHLLPEHELKYYKRLPR